MIKTAQILQACPLMQAIYQELRERLVSRFWQRVTIAWHRNAVREHDSLLVFIDGRGCNILTSSYDNLSAVLLKRSLPGFRLNVTGQIIGVESNIPWADGFLISSTPFYRGKLPPSEPQYISNVPHNSWLRSVRTFELADADAIAKIAEAIARACAAN